MDCGIVFENFIADRWCQLLEKHQRCLLMKWNSKIIFFKFTKFSKQLQSLLLQFIQRREELAAYQTYCAYDDFVKLTDHSSIMHVYVLYQKWNHRDRIDADTKIRNKKFSCENIHFQHMLLNIAYIITFIIEKKERIYHYYGLCAACSTDFHSYKRSDSYFSNTRRSNMNDAKWLAATFFSNLRIRYMTSLLFVSPEARKMFPLVELAWNFCMVH